MQDLLNTANVGNQLVSPDRQLSPLFNNSTWTTQKYGPDLYAASLTLSSLATVDGSSNNDVLRGNGVKILSFGAQDELFGGAGGDFLDAGDGDDRLFGEAGKDWLLGRSGQDQLWGGNGGDYLDGGDGDDRLYGEAGRDWLLGGDGQDQLFGGDGTDILNGNQGDNRLTGGAGSDVFVIGRSGKSWVEDFQVGVDVLALDGLTFEQLRIFNQNGEAWITTLDNQPVAFLKGVDAGLLSVKDFADVSITAVLGNVEADWAKAFEDYTKNGGFGNGAFTVGQSGQVSIDYLFDGSGYEGQLAIFSLTGMEGFLQGDPDGFMQEAARRALSNSGLGYTVIFDPVEGARFSGEVGYEGNFNGGQYLGAKGFSMRPGEKFAVMLVPNGKVEDVRDNGLGLGGGSTPMFSIASLNLGRSNQFAQVIEAKADDKSFAFEDTGLWGNSDRDFNDVVFQMKGAVGSSLLLDSVIMPEKDWRSSVVGQQLEQYAVDPLDLAGEKINDARRINISNSGKTYQGWVGSIDTDDFHSFSLGTTHDLSLSLDGLTADANLELLDLNGNVILSSRNLGRTSELIVRKLEAGAYRIRVSAAETRGTPYNLKFMGKPLFFDSNGNPIFTEVTTTGSEARIGLDLNQSRGLINVDNFRSGNLLQGSRPEFNGINGGNNLSIAILDTGIDVDHPFFGPDTNGPDADGNIVADRIIFQQNFADNNMNADDLNGHGTHVASIAASSDAAMTGVAPGSNLIALKVLGGGTDMDTFFAGVEQALQWVLDNVERNNIVAVNMSFSDRTVNINGILLNGNFSTNEQIQNAQKEFGIADEILALKARNVIIVATAGNHFLFHGGTNEGEGYPGVDPNLISVGSVLDGGFGSVPADQIAGDSQRGGSLTQIFSPGAQITAAGLGGGQATLSGTSMAAPHIAGMAALAQQLALQQLNRQLTPDEFSQLLYSSGVSIADPATGTTTFRRADMLNLANAIMELRPPNNQNIDLSAVNFDVVQQSLSKGDKLDINFQVQNTGFDRSAPFSVSFYLSDNDAITLNDYLLGDYRIASIPGQGTPGLLTHQLTLPSSNSPIWNSFRNGNAFIGMIVDRFNDIGETNETNNIISDRLLGRLTVIINRLVGDFDGAFNDSDFYTLVSFSENPPNDENLWLRSPTVDGSSDLSPNWNLSQLIADSIVPITIRVYDEDGFLTFGNDWIDIDPQLGNKDLNLFYNVLTGEISGDVTGVAGQRLSSTGSGKDDSGTVEFTIGFDPIA